MKSYLIDEIPREDMNRAAAFLEENAMTSGIEGLFWARVPEDLLSPEQYSHTRCTPHVFAVELGPDWIKLELFVRSLYNMRCTCNGYTTGEQRDFIFKFAESIGVPGSGLNY